jgi:nitroimidazol reductase NimA-like FMN-containing flavoprotein (pyridoxamine 5'-phosphate oxidase superfamily)
MKLPIPSDRTRLHRHSDRAVPDLEAARAILDEALTCHLAFLREGAPVVLPTIHTRVGNDLYFHGAQSNFMLRAAIGQALCCAVTLVDGLVLARSAFHHSMNYRSVVVFGEGTEVTDPARKLQVLEALVEHAAPGRLADLPPITDDHVRKTLVVGVPIREFSCKVRSGPAGFAEREEDPALWAGVLPLRLAAGTPVTDDRVPADVAVPASVTGWSRG